VVVQIRKNDSVMVISGKERGKTGKVLRVNPSEGSVIIERVNVVKRHTKPRGPQQSGGIIEKEASIPASNIMIMCDKCNAPVRVGRNILTDGNKVRVCRRCGETLD
jgi:large subunit ribosomal protein L24